MNRKKITKEEILNKMYQLFNDIGFTKESLKDRSKDELKPVLRQIYRI